MIDFEIGCYINFICVLELLYDLIGYFWVIICYFINYGKLIWYDLEICEIYFYLGIIGFEVMV